METEAMTNVQFLSHWRHYNGGEQAVFSDGLASELISGGIALKVIDGVVQAGPTVDAGVAAIAQDQQGDSSGDEPAITLDETT